MVGDLTACELSEVAWRRSGQEKFNFESPHVCLVFNAGEIAVIQYGVNEILGMLRTEYTNAGVLRLVSC
jgi:intraflagellar transport protein 172